MEKQQNLDSSMQYGNQPDIPPSYSPTDPQTTVQPQVGYPSDPQPLDYPSTSTTTDSPIRSQSQQYGYQPMPQTQYVTQQPQQVMIQQPVSTAIYSNHPQQLPMAPQQVVYQQAVVSNQPTSMVVGGGQLKDWSTGMCDCCEDMHSCICVTFFPHCFACGLAQRMNESCCVTCAVPGGLIAMRSTLRTRHGIKGDICGDCCDFMWCGWCVMCQMSREMDKLGYPKGACCGC